jgi:hypothetical protein
VGPPDLFLSPGAVQKAGQRRKEWHDGATEDANDAHDDSERSDPMKKIAGDAATMPSIADPMILVEHGLVEVRTLLFRKKKREKQRR